jgi:hypothetical protein
LPLGTLPYRIFGASTSNGAQAGIPQMARTGANFALLRTVRPPSPTSGLVAPCLIRREDQSEVGIELANMTFCVRNDDSLDQPRWTAPLFGGRFECRIGLTSCIPWFYISACQIDLCSPRKRDGLRSKSEAASAERALEPDPIGLNSRAWIAVGLQARLSVSRGATSPDFQNRSRTRAGAGNRPVKP